MVFNDKKKIPGVRNLSNKLSFSGKGNTKPFSYKCDLQSYLNSTLLISKYFTSLGEYLTFVI